MVGSSEVGQLADDVDGHLGMVWPRINQFNVTMQVFLYLHHILHKRLTRITLYVLTTHNVFYINYKFMSNSLVIEK